MKGKSFDELLRATPAKVEEIAEGEVIGSCASPPEPKGSLCLLVLGGTQDTRAFQYVHLGFASYAASGTSFVVEFNEPEKWRLIVRGRKLWEIFVNIQRHALEWISKVDRDFGESNVPVITDIRVERVKASEEDADE